MDINFQNIGVNVFDLSFDQLDERKNILSLTSSDIGGAKFPLRRINVIFMFEKIITK